MTARKRTAFAAPAWAAEQRFGKQGGVGLHATLLTLANYADEDFSCFPSNERLADETEQDVRTIRRHLELFRELGLVLSERRHSKDGYRTSDRHYLQLDTVVTPEQVEAARSAIELRNEERRAKPRMALVTGGEGAPDAPDRDAAGGVAPKAQGDIVSSRCTVPQPPAYRTVGTDLEDIARSEPRGHQVSQELLGEALEGTPSSKTRGRVRVGDTGRGCRLDPEWVPPVEIRRWALAKCPGVDLKAEHEQFVDYWADLPGVKGRKVSWDRTWRNWMRKAYRDLQREQQRAARGRGGTTTTGSVTDERARGWKTAAANLDSGTAPQPPQQLAIGGTP